jgi:Tic22-like family
LTLYHRNKDDATTATAETGDEVVYPALSQKEIEEFMEHIPVFAVTDSNGAGVVLKPDNDTSVFYFFMNPLQANATMQQLKGSATGMDLKVSAFSLGRIWFNLINSGADKEVLLKQPGADDTDGEATKGVQYRLVPETRDLIGARMLLTMTPEDAEKLKESGGMTPELAQEAIERAMTQSPKFNSTFNEIPVFTIGQMRMQKPATNPNEEPVTLLPMYFSLQNMVGTWQSFMNDAPADVQSVEPSINVMDLTELVELLQKESPIDWRHVVLVPTAPDVGPGVAAGSRAPSSAAADPMAQMGGATLGDDE